MVLLEKTARFETDSLRDLVGKKLIRPTKAAVGEHENLAGAVSERKKEKAAQKTITEVEEVSPSEREVEIDTKADSC